jgi:putative pyruvate formate lyase activating enzyme
MKCNICPRECNIDRETEKGICGMPWEVFLARAEKHYWEEPPISGKNGSGAVFFSGCSLKCVFCQNYGISHEKFGKKVSTERLSEIFFELYEKGVHNVNLVNPTHYTLQIKEALLKEKPPIPIVYNCGGYEKVQSLKMLEGLVDIYLPDYKYISPDRAEKYSKAENYGEVVLEALKEMKRQCPENIFDSEGIMQKGLIIRHLILPKNTNQSLKILDSIKENLGTDTHISLMAQYTPMGNIENIPELQRRITKREYEKVLTYAIDIGFQNIYTQDFASASEVFIPDFDCSGV